MSAQFNVPIVEGLPPQPRKTQNCPSCRSLLEFVTSAPVVNVRCYKCENIFMVEVEKTGQQKSETRRNGYDNTSMTTKDTSYYQALGVEPSATADEIKKAYYKLARLHHPDKNTDDPEAETKFKKISEAYQILSDPSLRERYDAYGKEGVAPEGGFMNPREFFNGMFGGGKFDDFIGELSLAAAADDVTPEERERQQQERVNKLAAALLEKIDPYMKGRNKEFEQLAASWVTELKGESYGIEILQTIGYIYEQEGKKSLGGFFGFAAEFSSKAHAISSTVGAVKAAVQLQKAQKEMDETSDQTKKAHLEQKLMADGLAALWKLGKLEVEATLRRVCDTILTTQMNKGVDKNILQKRAEALKTLGRIFQNCKD